MRYVYPFGEARYRRDAEQGDESGVFEVVPVYLPDADPLKSMLEREFSSCIEVRDLSVPLKTRHNLELQIQPLPGSENVRRKVTLFCKRSATDMPDTSEQVSFEVSFNAKNQQKGGRAGDIMLVHHLLGPILAGQVTGYTATDIGESFPFDGMKLQLHWCDAANNANLKQAVIDELNAISVPSQANFHSTVVAYVTRDSGLHGASEIFEKIRGEFPDGVELSTSCPLIEGDRPSISILLPAQLD